MLIKHGTLDQDGSILAHGALVRTVSLPSERNDSSSTVHSVASVRSSKTIHSGDAVLSFLAVHSDIAARLVIHGSLCVNGTLSPAGYSHGDKKYARMAALREASSRNFV